MTNVARHPASFKDPAGFIFEANGKIYRQVNKVYGQQYQHLMESGLYNQLISGNQLIPHSTINENLTGEEEWLLTLIPEQLSFISYPYEWCFDQLKDAALLTLSVLRTSLDKGMILKDATPFNIQFVNGKPLLIDTLSFDRYDETMPWVAYRQFCESFLFPLYLEHYLKIDCIKWLSNYIHGIPVDVTAKLLPWRSKWNLGVRLHVMLQNNVRIRKTTQKVQPAFSKQKLLNLITHLESIIRNLSSGYPSISTWSNYYDETILGKEYLDRKEIILKKFLGTISYTSVLDLGANDGYFSRLLAKDNKSVLAVDSDSRCINNLYQLIKREPLTGIIPLIIDLSNPSPAIGFNNTERSNFGQRAKADLALALALIHHLVIGKNIPLPELAGYFAKMAPQLIIEFVPKEDEKVKQLLSERADIFSSYDAASFETNFSRYYTILAKELIPGTTRTLYCLARK